jgi:hypothetical protein
MFRASSSVHNQEFIHCTLSNGLCHTAVEQDQGGTAVSSWSCSKAIYKPVWHIPLLSVQRINSWWWTEELPEIGRVSWKNNFVKLVHLVGIITKKLTLQSSTEMWPSCSCVRGWTGLEGLEEIFKVIKSRGFQPETNHVTNWTLPSPMFLVVTGSVYI